MNAIFLLTIGGLASTIIMLSCAQYTAAAQSVNYKTDAAELMVTVKWKHLLTTSLTLGLATNSINHSMM